MQTRTRHHHQHTVYDVASVATEVGFKGGGGGEGVGGGGEGYESGGGDASASLLPLGFQSGLNASPWPSTHFPVVAPGTTSQ